MICNICPRKCNIDRDIKNGYCNSSNMVKLALCNLHFSEEPVISGENGSGTIFFGGCNLRCVFCQNYDVSRGNIGQEVSVERLAEIFKELEEQGACNINLVTPTHYALQIVEALKIYKPKIPIVYNTNGYERSETLKMLSKYIDIYLTDFKYYDNSLAKRFSDAKQYLEIATEALEQMIKNQPQNVFGENGLMKKGVIVRHLVLPNHTNDSIKMIEYINKKFGNGVLLSVMSQYVPMHLTKEYEDINRTLKPLEYKRVIQYVSKLGFNGFMQELSSSCACYIPNFNLDGVEKRRQ